MTWKRLIENGVGALAFVVAMLSFPWRAAAGPNDYLQFGRNVVAGYFNSDSCEDFATVAGYDVRVYLNDCPGGVVDDDFTLDVAFSETDVGGSQDSSSFGQALAAGDFNCDGKDDLAIGQPSWSTQTGSVFVVYSDGSGLDTGTAQILRQGILAETAEQGDYFGWALAAGNFNGAGCDDLAISAPNEQLNGDNYAGIVHVIYGIPDDPGTLGEDESGLSLDTDIAFHQSSSGVTGAAEPGDQFGYSLAAGRLNTDDAYDDLAIGVPGETFLDNSDDEQVGAGVVQVVFGSASGLDPAGTYDDQVWHQDKSGIAHQAEADDNFGRVVAVATSATRTALIVGVPREDVQGNANGGIVHVIYTTSGGLTSTDNFVVSLATLTTSESVLANDEFGEKIRTGSFAFGGTVAIGAPFKDVGGTPLVNAGIVVTLDIEDDEDELDAALLWTQDTIVDSQNAVESPDAFGYGLACVNGALVVGVPQESHSSSTQNGLIHVIYSTADLDNYPILP